MSKGKGSLTRKNAWTGFFFTIPFCLGFLFFFLRPLIQSLSFMFSEVKVGTNGYETSFTGLDNLKYIFQTDVNFSTYFISSLTGLVWKVPIIIIASLFISVIINKKFAGRVFVRAIFFLPVIIASGIVMNIIKGDVVAGNVLTGSVVSSGTIFKSSVLQDILIRVGMKSDLVNFFTNMSNNLFDLFWKTGIQMIVFLAGLQGISPALYEASSIEGATAWENFWKITIPMLKPIVLVNVVYTIVDNFTDTNNKVMALVLNNLKLVRLGWASAMAWSYFVLIAIILVITMFFFSRTKKRKPD